MYIPLSVAVHFESMRYFTHAQTTDNTHAPTILLYRISILCCTSFGFLKSVTLQIQLGSPVHLCNVILPQSYHLYSINAQCSLHIFVLLLHLYKRIKYVEPFYMLKSTWTVSSLSCSDFLLLLHIVFLNLNLADGLGQGLANFSREEPDSKHFRFPPPDSVAATPLCHRGAKQPQTVGGRVRSAVSQHSFMDTEI